MITTRRSLAAAAFAVTALIGIPAAGATAAGPAPAPAAFSGSIVAGDIPIPEPYPGAAVHGPDPTATSVTKNGTYTYATVRVPRGTAGSAGGTIYYPTNAAAGETFAGLVTVPGFMEPGSVMSNYGTRMASHGFVVFVADTYTSFDQPPTRAYAASKAVAALRANTTVAGILDGTKIALAGHSMGGGGVLYAAESMDLKAVIAVHPWAQKGFAGVTEPSLVIGGGLDNVAPLNTYAVPIYQSLTNAQFKALLVKLAGTHWAGTVDDPQIMSRNLAFLKVQVDGDERYRQFLCAPAQAGTSFYSTC